MKTDGKHSAASGTVFNIDRCVMRLDNPLDDRKPKTRATQIAPVATPETLKDQIALAGRYANAAIANTDYPIRLNNNLYCRFLRRMV